MYKCYVLPLLDYFCQLYFPLTLKNIELVESMQKVLTKRLYGPKLSYLDYSGRLELFCMELWREDELSLTYYCFISLFMVLVNWMLFPLYLICSDPGKMVWKSTLNCLVVIIADTFTNIRVAKIWDELPISVVTTFNIDYFKDQLNSEEVFEIINKFIRCTSFSCHWLCVELVLFLVFLVRVGVLCSCVFVSCAEGILPS